METPLEQPPLSLPLEGEDELLQEQRNARSRHRLLVAAGIGEHRNSL